MDIKHLAQTVVAKVVVQERLARHFRVNDSEVTRGQLDMLINELNRCWYECRDVIKRDHHIYFSDVSNWQIHGPRAMKSELYSPCVIVSRHMLLKT